MSDVLSRIAHDKRVAQMPTPERAYEQLKTVALEGGDLTLTDNELVKAISRAIWHHELATAQYGLSELEERTAVQTYERQAA